jgi:hypothetical protein
MIPCFKKENTFIIVGHGNNYFQNRYQLKENEYGAVAGKCGEILSYTFKSLRNFFQCEIPKPSANVSLKNVSESIYPNIITSNENSTYKKFGNFKIYRPKLPLNTEETAARWTVPDLKISLFDYTIDDFSNNYKVVSISLSGVYSADAEVSTRTEKLLLDIEDLNKTIIEILNNYSNPTLRSKYILSFNFIKKLQILLDYSKFNFINICKIVNLNKYIYQKQIKSGKLFEIFQQMSDDKEFLKKELFNITISQFLDAEVYLSFIYNFISDRMKGEDFIIVTPVCRVQNPKLTKREQAVQRRFSQNYSGTVAYPNILDPINPRSNNTNVGENPQPPYMSSSSGGRRKTRRQKRRTASRRRK